MRLTSLEECSQSQRDVLIQFKNTILDGKGTPLGVLGSVERLVFLVQGELVVYRPVSEKLRQGAYELAHILSPEYSSAAAPFFIEVAERGTLWAGRRFFESTLGDNHVLELDRDTLGRMIFSAFVPLISAKKIHGNICFNNIAFVDGALHLLDAGLCEGTHSSAEEEWGRIVSLTVQLYSRILSRDELTQLQSRGARAHSLQEKLLWLECLSPETSSVEDAVIRKNSSQPIAPQTSTARIPAVAAPDHNARFEASPGRPVAQTISLMQVAIGLLVLLLVGGAFFYRQNRENSEKGLQQQLHTDWARGDVSSIGAVLDLVARDPDSEFVAVVEKDFGRDIPWGFEVDPRPYFTKGVGALSHLPEDLSAAIAISIRREDLITESRLETLSPTGILYLCGAMERPLATSSTDALRKLQVLPQPLNEVFQLAQKIGISSSLGDTKLRILCRLSWGVMDSAPEPLLKELLQFTGKEQSQTKAAVMLLVLSKLQPINTHIADVARAVLKSSGYEQLKAREVWLSQLGDVWESVSPATVLELIAGSFPDSKQLSLEARADLSSFPHQEISVLAKKSVVDDFDGLQKEAVGNILAAAAFTRQQKTLLISALKSPPEVLYAVCKRWFSLQPAPEAVLVVLSKGGLPESFNLNAVLYLQNKKHPVSMKILPDLLVHQDKVVRAFGYALIPTDTEAGIALLKKAIAFEKDASLRAKLEGLLSY